MKIIWFVNKLNDKANAYTENDLLIRIIVLYKLWSEAAQMSISKYEVDRL